MGRVLQREQKQDRHEKERAMRQMEQVQLRQEQLLTQQRQWQLKLGAPPESNTPSPLLGSSLPRPSLPRLPVRTQATSPLLALESPRVQGASIRTSRAVALAAAAAHVGCIRLRNCLARS